MNYMKLNLGDSNIMRKHRIQTANNYVSVAVEEFTCESKEVMIELTRQEYGREVEFGIGKLVDKISSRHFVHRYVGLVNGGT